MLRSLPTVRDNGSSYRDGQARSPQTPKPDGLVGVLKGLGKAAGMQRQPPDFFNSLLFSLRPKSESGHPVLACAGNPPLFSPYRRVVVVVVRRSIFMVLRNRSFPSPQVLRTSRYWVSKRGHYQ